MTPIFYINSKRVEATHSLTALLQFLPDNVGNRAVRYRQPQDAYNFVLGRLLLRRALLENSLPATELEAIEYTAIDKPFLPDLHFSITHSKEWVACSFSTDQEVGLDVEVPRVLKKAHFRHCFSQKEWDEIMDDESLHTFYQYWTAKEAVLKATGLGLGHLLDMTVVDLQEVYVKLPEEDQASHWQLQHFALDGSPAYGCLCTKTIGRIVPELLTIETLLD
ncbi:MAG: 4'-phosphopantetheinyl transferase family protein [Aureispira sp.]